MYRYIDSSPHAGVTAATTTAAAATATTTTTAAAAAISIITVINAARCLQPWSPLHR